jgi:hypothetical protein
MNKPSRRAVVRTGVWAVPVVGTAAAAPAFARTGEVPPVSIDGIGQGGTFPGKSVATYLVDGQTITTVVDFTRFDPCQCTQNGADPSATHVACG